MKSKKPFRYSLKFEITALFFVLLAGAVFLCWFVNRSFLGQYYISEKQSALYSAYESLNSAAVSNQISSDDFNVELEKIAGRDNISVVVMNKDSQTIKCYAADLETMMRRLWDNLLGTTDDLPDTGITEESIEAGSESEGTTHNGTDAEGAPDGDTSADSEQDGSDTSSDRSAASGAKGPAAEEYYIVSRLKVKNGQESQIVLDTKTDTQYIEMWGILDDDSIYLMRTAIESIRNSTNIANQFFLYVGLFAIFLGFIISLFLGSRITRPIIKLTEISRRMKDLDFSAKYEGRDRTEIAVLGDNINEMSAALEKTISELKTANAQLQNDIQAKEQVEALQREFIANVTHELKTPIALIEGYAEGLKEGISDDPDSRDFYCDVISDEAAKMNSMVQKLLELMHLEFGSDKVNMERFNVTELIRNYLESASLLARDQDIRVDFVCEEPFWVWADRFMTEEVFQNYFTNALHHCDKEKVIDIKVTPKQNCVRISVFNSGNPIPEESVSRIWDKFYKVDKARTREYGGSGVGLSIVKAIMDLMHQGYGVINFDNGVEFWFELETEKNDSNH